MDELHKQSVDLFHKYQNFIDKPDEPLAIELKKELQELIVMFKKQLNARNLENQAKHIQDIVLRLTDEMSPSERLVLKDSLQDMRMALREHF